MFLFVFPMIAAAIGVIIALLCFFGICLLVIGCTGVAMHKIHQKQTQTSGSTFQSVYSYSSIVLGIAVLLLPLAYVLYIVLH